MHLSVFTFTQLFSKAKKRSSGRSYCPLTPFFLENPRKLPHKPYIAGNDSLTVWVYLY